MRRGRRPDRRAETRQWVDALVRSGLCSSEELHQQVAEALRVDLGDAEADLSARSWIAAALESWHADAAGWPEVTDHDRLQQAFEALERGGVAVLQGCADHWEARDLLATREPTPLGVAWFTPADVWHAVDEGMLEVNLWHGTTANAAPGDPLLVDVLAAFGDAGLEAHFDEGRIEVAARWQRRPWSRP